jgi:hypothetical protein
MGAGTCACVLLLARRLSALIAHLYRTYLICWVLCQLLRRSHMHAGVRACLLRVTPSLRPWFLFSSPCLLCSVSTAARHSSVCRYVALVAAGDAKPEVRGAVDSSSSHHLFVALPLCTLCRYVALLSAGDAKPSALVYFLIIFCVVFSVRFWTFSYVLRYVCLLAAGDAKPEVREAGLLTIPYVVPRAGTWPCSLRVTPSLLPWWLAFSPPGHVVLSVALICTQVRVPACCLCSVLQPGLLCSLSAAASSHMRLGTWPCSLRVTPSLR